MQEPEGATLNEAVLRELAASTGDDTVFVRELVETYLADGPAQLDGIRAAIDADDAAALVRPAHTLKSSSATVGAERLAAIARRLELAGRSGALDAVARADLTAIETAWTDAVAAFATWLEGSGAR